MSPKAHDTFFWSSQPPGRPGSRLPPHQTVNSRRTKGGVSPSPLHPQCPTPREQSQTNRRQGGRFPLTPAKASARGPASVNPGVLPGGVANKAWVVWGRKPQDPFSAAIAQKTQTSPEAVAQPPASVTQENWASLGVSPHPTHQGICGRTNSQGLGRQAAGSRACPSAQGHSIQFGDPDVDGGAA